MSTTAQVVQYQFSSGVSATTEGGTEYGVSLAATVVPGTDFDDSTAAAFHAALVSAMQGAGWDVESADISVYKNDATTVTYATDYTSAPLSFS